MIYSYSSYIVSGILVVDCLDIIVVVVDLYYVVEM